MELAILADVHWLVFTLRSRLKRPVGFNLCRCSIIFTKIYWIEVHTSSGCHIIGYLRVSHLHVIIVADDHIVVHLLDNSLPISRLLCSYLLFLLHLLKINVIVSRHILVRHTLFLLDLSRVPAFSNLFSLFIQHLPVMIASLRAHALLHVHIGSGLPDAQSDGRALSLRHQIVYGRPSSLVTIKVCNAVSSIHLTDGVASAVESG